MLLTLWTEIDASTRSAIVDAFRFANFKCPQIAERDAGRSMTRSCEDSSGGDAGANEKQEIRSSSRSSTNGAGVPPT